MKCNSVFNVFLLTLTILFNFSISFGQTKITGTIIDPDNLPIELATVSLLNSKDSTVVNYTITDSKGVFSIETGNNTPLLLNIYSMGYTPYYKPLNITEASLNLETIILKEDLAQLDEVVISAIVPIQIKKDTVAFDVNSFKVNHDDNIEGLLKKLPGLEIDTDGTVIAQGNQVSRIFVDGKEFFGGDPAIVLKNLSADAISKVEVIDKDSDETELTGVNDGNKEVIINLSLKKSKKNKGFGSTSAGMGLDNRYFGNLNYNLFSSKTQLSVIGKFNNINVTGSNIQGFLKNADGISGEVDDDSDDDFAASRNNLSGFLTTAVSGIHYGHEFKKKEFINADYFYSYIDNKGNSKSVRTTFSNSNNFAYLADNTFDNISNNHNFNFNYENKSNKSSSLLVKGKIITSNKISNTTKDGEFRDDTGEIQTTNKIDSGNDTDKKTGNISVNYYKRLPKDGRSFSTGVMASTSNLKRDTEQNTLIVRRVGTPKEKITEQMTTRDDAIDNTATNFNFRYTEPLGGNHFLKADSFFISKNLNEDINQFRIRNGEEEPFIYKYRHLEQSYQTAISHNFSKKNLTFYSKVELQDITRYFGVIDEPTVTRSQFYVNPSALFQYKPKIGQRIRLSYRRFITNPRSGQSSTVINDLNPFSIRKGNPDLRAEKTDALQLVANINKFSAGFNFNTKLEYRHTQDAIVQNITINDDFVRVRSYDNIGVRQRLATRISLSKKISSLGVRYTVKNINNFETSNALVNQEINEVKSQDFTGILTLENANKDFVDIKLGAKYNLNTTAFSILKNYNRDFTRQQYFTSFDYDASQKLNLNTQFDYIIFTDNIFESDQKLPIWNTAISYSFSERKNNIVKLLLIDLLDKNVDIYRKSTTNYFEETTTESLGRYVILSYTYRLGRGKKKKMS
ncbi:outer membrane beta-barrel protein [Tamlana sp. 2201CG12-4]|uniref:outer membrane beta-barrel protein n=1 Tax=Tamlana sp. 2201CG12-4 TaxID=3112582 RepID=UPI002DB608A4|nr:outer membrane beta-barrel protein [Tamlana sp. 2201CG12-4]MEC3905571.1 outer membrane beta-barrel protein [Tamlana sp. 2201CG12-4]